MPDQPWTRRDTGPRVFRALRRPLEPERRASLSILVGARWFLIATAVFTVDYRPAVDARTLAILNLLILGAALLNLLLHGRLRAGQPVTLTLPLLASIYDAAAVTVAIGLVDGYENQSFVLYSPALLAISVVFPGRWSVLYALAAAIAYLGAIILQADTFQGGNPAVQRVLALRLAAMAATVFIANLVIKIERARRERAVAAEAARAEEVRALERRAREAERAAEVERRRLSQEVHDGISQEIYMLTLGLETAGALAAEGDERLAGRLKALVHLAKQTLLDTRNLLFDLEQVMAGQTSLAALVRNQAEEFTAVTGVAVDVTVCGEERRLSPGAVGEVYRVVQEGLANVYRHAEARAVRLRLTYRAREMELTIADNGHGFDPSGARARGRGLANMRDRTSRLGGRLLVESAPGRGTTLTALIPHEEGADGADPPPVG